VPLFALALLELRFPWIDPVAIPLPGPLDLRWYGLGYLVGFAIAYFLLRKLIQDGRLSFDYEALGDLITASIIGLFIGARLGYILFYDFGSFAADPSRIVRVWEGGLSFHGGLIGMILGCLWFARRVGISFFEVGDGVTMVAGFGIFVVRCANFINGELYGRVTTADVPWAMRFPTDPVALRLLGADRARSMREREEIIGEAYRTGLWDQVMEQVPLRHPSQLYQGLTEGLLVGIILWTVYLITRRRGITPPVGTFGGLFLVCYGTLRFIMENFRQPDAHLGTVLGPLTMGQTLSSLMVVGGIGVLLYVRSNPRYPGEKVGGKGSRQGRRS
jgi:phosphatidylglycerol---prolipoprotein diacylglyceryl transferase